MILLVVQNPSSVVVLSRFAKTVAQSAGSKTPGTFDDTRHTESGPHEFSRFALTNRPGGKLTSDTTHLHGLAAVHPVHSCENVTLPIDDAVA